MTTDEIMKSISMTQKAQDTRDRAIELITSYKKAGYSKKETTLLIGGLYLMINLKWLWPYVHYLIRKNWGKL